MSDFATAFYNIMAGGKEAPERRAAALMGLCGVTHTEAVIIDDAINQGTQEAARAIGAAIDSLKPRLQRGAVPLFLQCASSNLEGLETSTVLGLMGAEAESLGATPGCRYDACKHIRIFVGKLERAESGSPVQ